MANAKRPLIQERSENDMTPSNTPDADGTYNDGVSIELVSQSIYAYRYKVTLHDGYTIPEGSAISLDSNIYETKVRLY